MKNLSNLFLQENGFGKNVTMGLVAPGGAFGKDDYPANTEALISANR